jgi:hypothetical protein
VGLLWKNGLGFLRDLRWSWFAAGIGCFLFLLAMLTHASGSFSQASGIMFILWAMLAFSFSVIGPVELRFDLRRDLANLQLLKTMPLGGAALVAGGIAGAALALTVLQVLILGMGATVLPFSGLWARLGTWVPIGSVVLVLFLIPLNALMVGAQNGLALLMPGWVASARKGHAGVELAGQQMLLLLISGGSLLLALPPALAVGGAILFQSFPAMSTGILLTAAVATWLTLWRELAFLVFSVGELFDDLDPVEAELLA